MKLRRRGFWSIVLVGGMIFSGGLPLSALYSAAQPLPSGSIQGQHPLSEILERHHKQLDEELSKKNQELEEKSLAEGRELLESERVKVVREVILKPHSTSPVKEVTLIVYELSDGSSGEFSATPIFQPWVTQPFAYVTEKINIDEGWYIIRYATPEENQDLRKKPEAAEPIPETQSEPLSFLDRILGIFSPSEALACPTTCPSPPYTHSACQRVMYLYSIEVARDGVKMQWQANPSCTAVILSMDKLCQPASPWQYLAPCDPAIPGSLFDEVTTRHTDSYENPGYPSNGTRAVVTSGPSQ